jgi:hypothetical protein
MVEAVKSMGRSFHKTFLQQLSREIPATVDIRLRCSPTPATLYRDGQRCLSVVLREHPFERSIVGSYSADAHYSLLFALGEVAPDYVRQVIVSTPSVRKLLAHAAEGTGRVHLSSYVPCCIKFTDSTRLTVTWRFDIDRFLQTVGTER